nr:ribonuclease H-like domain-containing protein [Tanacetum cinerariifolium]
QGESIVEPAKYVLPARANRGIPAKRYSSERISKGSKYPMANIAVGNLSKEAKAFTVSLYSENVPSNVEQALKSKRMEGRYECGNGCINKK